MCVVLLCVRDYDAQAWRANDIGRLRSRFLYPVSMVHPYRAWRGANTILIGRCFDSFPSTAAVAGLLQPAQAVSPHYAMNVIGNRFIRRQVEAYLMGVKLAKLWISFGTDNVIFVAPERISLD